MSVPAEAQARSRLTTAYMVSVFLGGVLGSLLATAIYSAAGWHATCAVGAGLALTALALRAVSGARRRGEVQSPSAVYSPR